MRTRMRRMLRKTIAVCLIAAMLVGVVPVDMLQMGMEKVEAANEKVDKILEFANSKLGSGSYYIDGQGYCQSFVKDCYESAGIYASSNPGSATEAKSRWMVSTDLNNIPIGACIYYNVNHVSLYVGNNQIIHLQDKVIKQTGRSTILYFDTNGDGTYETKMTEVGWGYQAGYDLYGTGNAGTPTPTYTSSFPLQNNGIYKIVSVLSGKTMEVPSGTTANSKQISLWSYSGEPWMQWKAVKHSDGYSFINVHTGKCLDVEGASTAASAKITQYDYSGNSAQRFKLIDQGNGKYGMVAVHSNLAIDVCGSVTDNGALLDQHAYHGGNNQLWTFELVESPGGTLTINYNANGAAVDTTGANYWADISTYKQTRQFGGSIVNFVNFSSFGLYKTGYHRRDGGEWNTKANGSGAGYDENVDYEISDIADISSSSKNVTVYAQWDPNALSIKYDKNGGSVNTASASLDIETWSLNKNYGAADFNVTNFSSLGLTRPYYHRRDGAEWNTKADGSGASYDQDVNYPLSSYADITKGNKTLTLYAQWDPNVLSIKYDKNGGSVNTASASLDIETWTYNKNYGSADFDVTNFSSFGLTWPYYHRRDGAEWNTKPDGSGISYDQDVDYPISDYADLSGGNKTLTLYAQWDPNTVTFKYNANGGIVDTNTTPSQDINTYTYTRKHGTEDYDLFNFTSFGLIRPGYVKRDGAEWNTKPDGTGISYDEDVKYPVSDYADLSGGNKTITLYAQWDQTDFEAPVISNFTASELTNKGFKISCDVTDNTQVSEVTAIVRAEEKDAEDVLMVYLQPSGNTYSGYVDLSEYHSEKGIYQISIGAADIVNNFSNMHTKVEHTPVTTLALSETEIEIDLGQTKTLEATLSPAEGLFPDIIWTSADTNIATVSDGVITGVAPGTTTITAECGGKTATCTVKVVKPFESISFNIADKSLFKNETCMLEVSFAPADANASTDLIWISSNPEVATVDENGFVVAQSAGNTQITATLENNPELSATCTVQVESYVVTFDTLGGSSVPSMECGKNEILSVQEPIKSGYAFTGWYKDAACTMPWDMKNDVVNSNLTLYAAWMEYHEGLWIVKIPDQQYTGKAIKPEIVVYHYAEKLEKGKDYTVSYKNNTKAGDENASKAPTVTVKGKGNYTGKETATFTILAKNLSDEDIVADNVYKTANGKVQKPSPVVKWNGKTLKKNKDYTLEYPDTATGAYQNNGTYTIRIVGKGNFCGERTVQLQITGGNLLSKVKVAKIPNQTYTGEAIKPQLTVKYGSAVLTEGIDYTVNYENHIEVGTATAILTGKGSYTGEKKVTFKIVGTPISKAKVVNLPKSVVYDGDAVDDVDYQLQMKQDDTTVTLVENRDYTVSYKSNSRAGTATILFTGINGYTGTLKKTFKITPYDILADTESAVEISQNLTVAYMKGGTVIEPQVTCFGKILKKGTDYKLSYKNNKTIHTGADSKKLPTVTISGKGNYKGKVTLNFTITEQNIGLLSMSAADKVYQNKAGKYVSKPVITDINGKKLKAGTDYEKVLAYTYTSNTTLADGTVRPAGAKIEASDILPAGTSVTVTAKGKGNYTGEISCTYRIVQSDIGKAKGKIATQVYTGQAITPGKEAITLKMGKVELADTDYEIVSYSNNIKKGTATVVVKGVGNYGGTKKITFKIKSKTFSWWWR